MEQQLLSMAGRLVLIHHVIRSICVYQLMLFEISKDGFQDMESICRELFWGLGEARNPRMPLVAWDNVLKSKLCGGVDITSFSEQAKALKYRSVRKLLKSYDTKWVYIA